jgi:acetyl esterase/lipase
MIKLPTPTLPIAYTLIGLSAVIVTLMYVVLVPRQPLTRADRITGITSDYSDTPKMEEVASIRRDVPYCEGGPQQSMDIYLPKTPDTSILHPVVFYIHGGGWSVGDKKNDIVDYYGSSLVESGVAFVSINYRLAPKYRYPVQNEDVSCAIATLAKMAPDLQVDTTKTMLFGDSAGGLLASMYALTDTSRAVKVRGVVSFYGTTDLVYQMNRKKLKVNNALNYLGKANDAMARKASPLHQKITSAPPFLFFHGDKDTTVSIQQAEKLYGKIRAVQPDTHFVVVNGAGHGFSEKSSPSMFEVREEMLMFILTHLALDADQGGMEEYPLDVYMPLFQPGFPRVMFP